MRSDRDKKSPPCLPAEPLIYLVNGTKDTAYRKPQKEQARLYESS